MPQDPDTQRELFYQAVEALGGQSAAAETLDLNVRTVRRLVSGESEIHDGTLERTAKALLAHAEHCKDLERQLSPAFADNRTDRQISGSANRGRHPASSSSSAAVGRTGKVRVKDPGSRCQSCGRTVDRGHTAACPNRGESWPTIEAELSDG